MNKLIILFLNLIILVGCGRVSYNVPAEFQPYVKQFEKNSLRYGGKEMIIINLIVNFKDLSELGKIGICTLRKVEAVGRSYDYIPEVSIDKEFWETATEASRKDLMDHELGHCILKRGHNENIKDEINTPESIMFPYHVPDVIGQNRYLEMYDYYLTELFTGKSEEIINEKSANTITFYSSKTGCGGIHE